MIFIDTDVAIALRDAEERTLQLVRDLPDVPVISMVTRIELESGANTDAGNVKHRTRLLDRFLKTIRFEYLNEADILAYGAIVRTLGFDRRTTLDRLIAAQAIVRGATLITRNGRDFRRIEGLTLIEWEPLAGKN